jgi:hypothetical protein
LGFFDVNLVRLQFYLKMCGELRQAAYQSTTTPFPLCSHPALTPPKPAC